jgi:hypothetical protein
VPNQAFYILKLIKNFKIYLKKIILDIKFLVFRLLMHIRYFSFFLSKFGFVKIKKRCFQIETTIIFYLISNTKKIKLKNLNIFFVTFLISKISNQNNLKVSS